MLSNGINIIGIFFCSIPYITVIVMSIIEFFEERDNENKSRK